MTTCPYTDDTTLHEHWWFGHGDAENPASAVRPVVMSTESDERNAYRQGARVALRG